MKKIILLCSLLLLISGCTAYKTDSLKDSYGYTVKDELGRNIYFTNKPCRIVSLTYGTDEILTELVGLDRIAAFSKWAGNEEISFISEDQVYIVGKKVEITIEDIISVNPDLVIASTAVSGELIKILDNMGINVYVASSPQSYEGMQRKISGIAQAVGEVENGNILINKMDNRLADLKEKLSVIDKHKQRTVIAFNFTGAMGRKDDLFDDMLNKANIRNGAAAGGLVNKGQILSKEQVIKVNPDIFLLPTWNFDNRYNRDEYCAQFMNDPAYADLKAIRQKQIIFVSDKYRYTASHHIIDAIEVLAESVYPEIF